MTPLTPTICKAVPLSCPHNYSTTFRASSQLQEVWPYRMPYTAVMDVFRMFFANRIRSLMYRFICLEQLRSDARKLDTLAVKHFQRTDCSSDKHRHSPRYLFPAWSKANLNAEGRNWCYSSGFARDNFCYLWRWHGVATASPWQAFSVTLAK